MAPGSFSPPPRPTQTRDLVPTFTAVLWAPLCRPLPTTPSPRGSAQLLRGNTCRKPSLAGRAHLRWAGPRGSSLRLAASHGTWLQTPPHPGPKCPNAAPCPPPRPSRGGLLSLKERPRPRGSPKGHTDACQDMNAQKADSQNGTERRRQLPTRSRWQGYFKWQNSVGDARLHYRDHRL